MTAAHEILTKAAGHMQDRASTYDKPEGERSMAQTVAIFNLYHDLGLTEAQGWHLLQILKDVRLFTRPGYHADSAEDCVAYAALKAEALAGSAVIPVDLEPTVIANVAAFNSNWQEVRDAARMVVEMDGEPNEQRRQDAAAEDEAWKAIEARMDVIGSNGNEGLHYAVGCATCHGRGRVQNHIGSMECPACHGFASCECRP